MGADPNWANWAEATSLYWAAKANRPDLVKVLLEAGASVAAEPANEDTSVHVAAEGGLMEVLEMLLAAAARMLGSIRPRRTIRPKAGPVATAASSRTTRPYRTLRARRRCVRSAQARQIDAKPSKTLQSSHTRAPQRTQRVIASPARWRSQAPSGPDRYTFALDT